MRTALLALLLSSACFADEIADLVKALGDDAYETREAAARRLIEIGEPAMPALREATKSTDAEVRAKASRALALIEWRRVLPKAMLEKFPTAPEDILAAEDDQRVIWVKILGSAAPGVEAVPAALRFLTDSSPRVRKDALLLISRRAEALPSLRDPSALEQLTPLLRDEDPGIRVLVLSIAGEWGRRAVGGEDAMAAAVRLRVVPEALAALGDGDGTVRSAAARALGRLGDPAAVARLSEAAGDPVSAVRMAAIEALGAIGDARGAAAAAKAIGDEGTDVVRAAIEACARMKAREAAPAIRAALAVDGRAPILRQAALEALAAIDPPAVEDARRCLGDPNAALRAIAWRIVIAAAPGEAVAASKDEDAEVRLVAALGLARAPRDAAVPALLTLLDDDRSATLRDSRGNDLLRGEVRTAAIAALEAVTGRKSAGDGAEAQAEDWKAWGAGRK